MLLTTLYPLRTTIVLYRTSTVNDIIYIISKLTLLLYFITFTKHQSNYIYFTLFRVC